jgi:hypothetical protein
MYNKIWYLQSVTVRWEVTTTTINTILLHICMMAKEMPLQLRGCVEEGGTCDERALVLDILKRRWRRLRMRLQDLLPKCKYNIQYNNKLHANYRWAIILFLIYSLLFIPDASSWFLHIPAHETPTSRIQYHQSLIPNRNPKIIKRTTVYAYPNPNFPCMHIQFKIRSQIVINMPIWIQITVPKKRGSLQCVY